MENAVIQSELEKLYQGNANFANIHIEAGNSEMKPTSIFKDPATSWIAAVSWQQMFEF